LYDLEDIWTGGFAGYVGYANGQPVTAAATMAAAGAVGIYSVATLPHYERSGYAETIVRHALERAREVTGLERSALQSTAVALPLYQRMGYEVVTRFAVYTS
jgi:ribosomal protein S18 acetylase RimI-like enzyme